MNGSHLVSAGNFRMVLRILPRLLKTLPPWEDAPLGRKQASQVVLVVKNPSANAGDVRDMVLIPGLRKSPGGGSGNPLQYSCLKNPMDRGVHRVAKSQTWLKRLSRHTQALLQRTVFSSPNVYLLWLFLLRQLH